MNRREKYSEFAGAGCAIQALGLCAPVVLGLLASVPGFIVGCVLAVVLLAVGSSQSNKVRCSACKNPLASAKVTMCPTCKAPLS